MAANIQWIHYGLIQFRLFFSWSHWDRNTNVGRKGVPLAWFMVYMESVWPLSLPVKTTGPSHRLLPLHRCPTSEPLNKPIAPVRPPLMTGRPAGERRHLGWSSTSRSLWEEANGEKTRKWTCAQVGRWTSAGKTGQGRKHTVIVIRRARQQDTD